jgi:anthranilate phosphoribosyltransferase
MAGALALLGVDRALVVAAEDGLDEISAAAPTRIVEVNGTEIVAYTVSPEDLGVRAGHGEDSPGGTPQENAVLARAVLDGEPGGARELALVNAGAAIYAAGGAASIAEGVQLAREAVDDGRAKLALERFIAATLQAS